jgi:hypothetical protein
MKLTVIRTWAIAQIVIGIAIVVSTAHYAPPAFEKMRDEAQRTGENLIEIAGALAAARITYAESATNLFATSCQLKDVEANIKDVGVKLGDVGLLFEKYGRKFERAERHNRESKIFWGKVETPFANHIADIYGYLKEWALMPSTNLCDVGRILPDVADHIGIQRETIAVFQDDRHPKVLQAMETSSHTIDHVGQMLSSCESITVLSKSIYILCGVVALLFIGNGVVLFVASTLGGAFSTPDRRPPAA